MFKKMFPLLLVLITILAASCTSVSPQTMAYLGQDERETINVIGSVAHTDWFGIGSGGRMVAEEYNLALEDAYRNSPPGTIGLKNIKAYKEPNYTPQILGLALALFGYYMAEADSSNLDSSNFEIGVALYLGGVALMGYNNYNYFVVAEPVN
jgi:hypothetical protein